MFQYVTLTNSCICLVDLALQNLYKQLLRASRQWRDLTLRMQSGLAYEDTADHPIDGSMAIFCPACPQPGLNLPEDWQNRYNKYVIDVHILYVLIQYLKGTNSSEPSLWMATSLQSI